MTAASHANIIEPEGMNTLMPWAVLQMDFIKEDNQHDKKHHPASKRSVLINILLYTAQNPETPVVSAHPLCLIWTRDLASPYPKIQSPQGFYLLTKKLTKKTPDKADICASLAPYVMM